MSETHPFLNPQPASERLFDYRLRRDIRDALISQMRFLKDTNCRVPEAQEWKALPDGPQQMSRFFQAEEQVGYMFSKFRTMAGWRHDAGVFSVSFEAIYGDYGKEAEIAAVEALRRYLDVPPPKCGSQSIVAELIGKPTQTWSGRRSSRDIYWNDDIEALFRARGGHEINARLGCREDLG